MTFEDRYRELTMNGPYWHLKKKENKNNKKALWENNKKRERLDEDSLRRFSINMLSYYTYILSEFVTILTSKN